MKQQTLQYPSLADSITTIEERFITQELQWLEAYFGTFQSEAAETLTATTIQPCRM